MPLIPSPGYPYTRVMPCPCRRSRLCAPTVSAIRWPYPARSGPQRSVGGVARHFLAAAAADDVPFRFADLARLAAETVDRCAVPARAQVAVAALARPAA